jgi:RHS repeat-associated protein
VTWHHYQWDAYNKLVGIGNPAVCGTSGTCLTYDALGRMVERSVNSTYNEVLYSPIGKTASMSGWATVNYSYLPLPGGGTLYSTGSTGSNRNYQHKDWLGSARLESVISSSTISLDRAYAPYGEVYANFGSSGHYNFTGDTQEVVADGATFDTDNRELNSGQGRWLSPDPARAGWNLYAYPTNPNSLTDPTGLGESDHCGRWCYSSPDARSGTPNYNPAFGLF